MAFVCLSEATCCKEAVKFESMYTHYWLRVLYLEQASRCSPHFFNLWQHNGPWKKVQKHSLTFTLFTLHKQHIWCDFVWYLLDGIDIALSSFCNHLRLRVEVGGGVEKIACLDKLWSTDRFRIRTSARAGEPLSHEPPSAPSLGINSLSLCKYIGLCYIEFNGSKLDPWLEGNMGIFRSSASKKTSWNSVIALLHHIHLTANQSTSSLERIRNPEKRAKTPASRPACRLPCQALVLGWR